MSKGAKPIKSNLTKTESKISKIIAKNLKKENIFFAGIDFIDQKLNGDINVTSPTGLKTYFDLTRKNLAKTFWKGRKHFFYFVVINSRIILIVKKKFFMFNSNFRIFNTFNS